MSSLRRLSLVKSLEYPIALLGRNPRSTVDDVHHQLFTFAARMNRYGAAARSELDGIRQQVVEDQAHLAAVGERGEILDVNVEPHALRHQRELLIFQDALDQGPQLEFGNLETYALGLPGAERQQIFNKPLQLHSVLAQYCRHLALAALQLADRTVHQEFGPFPYICQRSFELMRHMSQKSVLFLREIQQTASEPFQLRRQALEVRRSANGDGPGKRAAPEFADGAVDGANGPAEQVGEYAHHRQCQGYEQQRLPEQIALRTLSRELQARQFAVYLCADAVRHIGCHFRDLRERIDQVRHPSRVGGAALQFPCQPVGFGLERDGVAVRSGVERHGKQLVERGDQALLVACIDIEQIRAADDLIQARGTLECADFLEHALIASGPANAVQHQLFAAGRQMIHLDCGVHDREQQRGSHDREADQH